MKRVLLLNPPGAYPYNRDYFCAKVAKTGYAEHPVDFLFLSGWLHGRHEIRVLDAIVLGLKREEVLRRVAGISADVIVFLSGSVSWAEDFSLLAEIKELLPRSLLIGLGDVFRNGAFSRATPWLDAVLPDFTKDSLLRYLDGDVDALPRRWPADAGQDGRPTQSETFTVPVPRHELFIGLPYTFPFARRLPYATVLTDYGCPHRCDYCIYGTLGYKARTLENLVPELDHLAALGIRELFIKDQSFGSLRERSIQISRTLARRYAFSWTAFLRADHADPELLAAMKAGGCHTVMIGVESGDEAILRKHKPGILLADIERAFRLCREHRIQTVGLFMLGFPEDDAATCAATSRFARELGCDFASFNVVVPKPATPLADQYAGQAWSHPGEETDPSGIAVVSGSRHLSAGELRRIRREAVRAFYLRPRYLLKLMAQLRTPAQLRMWGRSAAGLYRETTRRVAGI